MSAGILAHLLGKQPYRELAAKVAAYGFPYVQLALSKAISDVDCSLGKLSPGLASEIGGAFASHGVKIAVLGCYVSLIEPEQETWRHHVDRFKEHLRHAGQFGAPIVALEVGKPVDQNQVADNWKRLHRALAELVEEAERWGVMIGLEAAQGHLIDSPESMAAALEQYPSSCVGVLLDPCNLMNAGNFARQDEIIRTSFDLFGSRIVSSHAKDLKWGANGELSGTAAGLGELNYPLFWRLLEQHKPHGFVTLEGVEEEQCGAVARFVREGRAAARMEL
ncbi:sugar phosphate isomerase/epimerase family protein [Paenibacillus sanguinis]|uniref:sugar phosphate isomerase/epimerase family protein n=1 Tax=Paenibacillus sanguinis TaxID=225906 RepID=UPI00036B27BF|nr:sugar phosphate isomerase/epimerase [Paenibacillus sanguinis]